MLDPPAAVSSIDIAQGLLGEGRFGGPVPAPAAFPARWPALAQGATFALGLLVPGTAGSDRRRRDRAGFPPASRRRPVLTSPGGVRFGAAGRVVTRSPRRSPIGTVTGKFR
ncbi:hypothetical protein ABT369_31865 [Dactylosporangium sp. NPDC000244]|uniref:hypothetical protein n=1 Tax=Dactylosporangium sp. NPDC000244 TaxID=3154365 RepID=UPI003317DA34